MDQGFAPTQAINLARHSRNAAKPVVAATELRRARRAEVAAPEVAAQQSRIGFLNGVRGWLTGIWNMEFFGGMAGGLFAGAAMKAKLPRVSAAIKAVTHAPIEAMREVGTAEAFRNPSRVLKAYLDHFAIHAAAAGGKATAWSTAAANKAAALQTNIVAKEATAQVVPGALSNAMSRGVDRLTGTAVGNRLQGATNWIAKKRLISATTAHDAALTAVDNAFKTDPVGFWAGARDSVTGFVRKIFGKQVAPVTTVTMSEHLAPFASDVAAASGMRGAARVAHLEGVAARMRTVLQSPTLPEAARKQANTAMGELGKAITSARAIHQYEGAVGGTLKTLMKTAATAAGRVPLFSTVVGVGVAAGLGATLLTSKMESGQTTRVYKDMVADLGGETHGAFMQAVRAAYTKQREGHLAKAGLGMISSLAEGAFMTLPSGGGMELVAAQFVPGMIQTLVPDNALLNAYETLRKDEAGTMKLEPAQRLGFIRELIAVMPAVAASGGSYNRLAGAMAEEMVARKMNVSAMVQLLGNEPAFTQMAAEVAQKQQAAKAAAQAPAAASAVVANNNTVSANDNSHSQAHTAEKVADSAEARYMAAEKPQLSVVRDGAAMHGPLVSSEKLAGLAG